MKWICIGGRVARSAVLVSLLACHQPAAMAADLYVIAHPATRLAAGDVREVFLGEKSFSESARLTPVDNFAAQPEFLSRVIKLEPGKYSTVWTKKSFRDGVNPPPLKSSDAEVIEFVRRIPGAIGYVSNAVPGVVMVGKF